MVFKSVTLLARSRGPDEFWRKTKIFKLSAHYRGRRRNCYSNTIRGVHRALVYATRGRKLKKEDLKELWLTRVTAACEEHNITLATFKEGLQRSNILLNSKILSELAVWEPRTFQSLINIAFHRSINDGFNTINDLGPGIKAGIVTRGMLKSKDKL